ncbi:hypothetical protein B0T19DRAFT_260569 [Cercophora scortea]|uniref:Uncharacterized protein n=1 Tax=Cercophora scortea TaxID=314031 RepID=A0AAE0M6F1_9PEZI|nr:hypothetical protein B0T19DRAFT_260569 [Cercophora scortea]
MFRYVNKSLLLRSSVFSLLAIVPFHGLDLAAALSHSHRPFYPPSLLPQLSPGGEDRQVLRSPRPNLVRTDKKGKKRRALLPHLHNGPPRYQGRADEAGKEGSCTGDPAALRHAAPSDTEQTLHLSVSMPPALVRKSDHQVPVRSHIQISHPQPNSPDATPRRAMSGVHWPYLQDTGMRFRLACLQDAAFLMHQRWSKLHLSLPPCFANLRKRLPHQPRVV